MPYSAQIESGSVYHFFLGGYNNTGRFWLAKNSWGSDWADRGFFRITFGTADVAHPEDTYSLINCFTTSQQFEVAAAWSDPWPVAPDPDDPNCFLYTATARDSISGMADHFQVQILDFIQANTRRGVIPTKMMGKPPRPEPQLQPNTSWAGQVFQVCNISAKIFSRVATDPCTTTPNFCNGRASSCTAGRCKCLNRYSGRHCQTDNGVEYSNVTLSGQQYRYYWKADSWMSWPDAAKECQQAGMRLARLYSPLHASELDWALGHVFKYMYWIGLNDRASQGSYVWTSGGSGGADVATDFYMWTSDAQPDLRGGPKRCVMAVSSRFTQYEYWPPIGGVWQTYDCDTTLPFVCGSAEDSTDPCDRFPCFSAWQPEVSCSPVPPTAASPLAITHNRTCTCKAGFEYNDEVGCTEKYTYSTVEVTVVGRLHRMYLSPQVTWTEANRICCEAGMKLVEIQDEGHATQLHSAYKAAGGWANYWLGLNDRAQEGSFTWTTGAGACLGNAATSNPPAAASYTHWWPGQPDNFCKKSLISENKCINEGEDCVVVALDGGDQADWVDITCSHRSSFVCMAVP
eukprot:gene10591-10749_t